MWVERLVRSREIHRISRVDVEFEADRDSRSPCQVSGMNTAIGRCRGSYPHPPPSDAHNLVMSVPRSLPQNGVAAGVDRVDVGACFHKQTYDFNMASPNGLEQDRIAAGVDRVDVRACFHKQTYHVNMASPNGLEQDRIAAGVDRVDVRAFSNQIPNGFE